MIIRKLLIALLPLLLVALLLIIVRKPEVVEVSLQELTLDMTWRIVPAERPVQPIIRGGVAIVKVSLRSPLPSEGQITCRVWLEGELAGEVKRKVSVGSGDEEITLEVPVNPGNGVVNVLYEFAGLERAPLYYRVEVELGGSHASKEGVIMVSLPRPRPLSKRF